MEQFLPTFSLFIFPFVANQYVKLKNPPKLVDHIVLPVIFYIVFLLIIGLVTFSISVKRVCPYYDFRRVIDKTIIYVGIGFILFAFANYWQWPQISWLELFPKMNELTLLGVFLAISSQIAYYLTRLLHSNC